jgi:hypothetical protein
MALVLSELDLNYPELLASRLRPLTGAQETRIHEPLAEIGYVILHRRVRDIVRCLYPAAKGLLGTLGKLGSEPLSKENYRLLIELHAHPENRCRAALLRHMPSIPQRTFSVLMALEPPYVSPKLVNRLGWIEDVEDFRRSVELIKRVIPGVSDDMLVSSLEMIAGGTSLRQWVQRWLERATCFWVEAPDFHGSDMVILGSAAAMRNAGRRFENCLESKIAQCALGRVIYIEYLPVPCIIELEALSGGWAFEAISGPKNTCVDSDTIRSVLKKLHAAGVQIPAQNWQAGRYNRVARFARIHDFSRDDIELIDEPHEICELGKAVAA